MKVAFFHDTPLIEDSSQNVYSVGFHYGIWKRYLSVFESLCVSTRIKNISTLSEKHRQGLKLSSGNNVSFAPIQNYRKNSDIFTKFSSIASQVRSVLSESDCAIIRLPSIIGIVACMEAIRMNKPWVVEVVGCAWDSYRSHGSILGKIFAPLFFILNRYFISKSDYAIYITKEFLQARYPSNGIVGICSNVYIEEVEEQVLKSRLERIDQLHKERPVVFGLIGSLDVEYKGHEMVLRALARIKKHIPFFKVSFLGGGNPEKWVKLSKYLGIHEHVEFIGTLPSGNEVNKWLDKIDISIQPSSAEAQGRSILEAMSRGCPVLASTVGGIPELIDKEWLVRPKDYIELSNRILALLSDSELLKAQSIVNFNKAKLYYQGNMENNRKSFFEEFRANCETKLRMDKTIKC